MTTTLNTKIGETIKRRLIIFHDFANLQNCEKRKKNQTFLEWEKKNFCLFVVHVLALKVANVIKLSTGTLFFTEKVPRKYKTCRRRNCPAEQI